MPARRTSSGTFRAPATGETSWYPNLVQCGHMFGWRVQHQRNSRTQSGKHATAIMGDNGWPDFVFSHPTQKVTLFREIKGPKTKTTDEQHAWLHALGESGLDVGVWRMPDDWPTAVTALSFGRAYAVGSTWRPVEERGMFG